MRPLSLLLVCLGATFAHAQHLTLNEWRQQSFVDMRLLPRYGDQKKSPEQLASDAEFVRLVLVTDSVPRSASEKLIAHGFDLMRKGDLTKAMYRFNQAFLLDSTNSDIYWGYGSFFMELDRPMMAHTMFRAGLSLDTTNTHLLNGEATAYLADNHALAQADSTAARGKVERALDMVQRAYRQDPHDPATLYRLSVCHMLLGECKKARMYYEQCLQLPDPAIEAGYEARLAARCPKP